MTGWRGAIVWCALLPAAAAQTATQPAAQEPARARGRFFAVTCHGGDDRTARLALAAVEPVWPEVCSFFGVPATPPEELLPVNLYRHDEGYLEADRKLTKGRFQANRAMFHWDTRSAHVAMQPPCSDRQLQQSGLPLQTQVMLQWEACHVSRATICANFRSHPGWFADGLAATTAAIVMQRLHGYDGAQPFFTQRWLRLRKLRGAGTGLRVEDVLADQTQGLEMRDRYAARVALFDHARTAAGDELREVAGVIRRSGGGDRFRAKVEREARSRLGSLAAGFREAIDARPIAWDEHERSLWCFGDDWHQAAFPHGHARALRIEPVVGGGLEAVGKVHVLDQGKRQLNFLFACENDGCYSLALVAGYGFTLFDHRYEGNRWLVLGNARVAAFVPGADAEFAVRARGTTVEVELAGKSLRFELPRPLPAAVRWGVGAQAGGKRVRYGSAGIWRDVRVRPYR